MAHGGAARHHVRVSLFRRVVAINTGVLVVAAAVLALSPATVSSDLTIAEAVVLGIGTLLVAAVNVLLLRRVFEPLERLSRLMRAIEPPVPGGRLTLEHPVAEVASVADALNGMLDRLELERQESGRRALLAQEAERTRVARELHDEVGQTLTGVVLQLEGLGKQAPPELQKPIHELQETARDGVERVREIARGLRPPALGEFGLRAALVSLATAVMDRTELTVRHRIGGDLPDLPPEQELALYRVVQESLTNAIRHAEATTVDVVLERRDGAVIASIRDDGVGIGSAPSGAGLGGMLERALLVGGDLAVGDATGGGTEVRLRVPIP